MNLRWTACTTLWGILAVLASIGDGHAIAAEPSLQSTSQPHMGTMVRIVADCDDPEKFQQAANAAFDRIRIIEQICSDYRTDSEVLILSAKGPTTEPVEVSDDLWNVLSQAMTVHEASAGAFDVTVGPLTKEWRRFRRRNQLDPQRIKAAMTGVGAKHVQLHHDSQSVSLDAANMRIDLGGIAKGYAIDAALEVLSQHGIRRALVDAGGDIVTGDAPRGQSGWKVGIANLDPKGPPILVAHIANSAVATSGDAFQFLEHDGKRYSHVLDPRTGYGVEHRGTVTVFAANATKADAWASALSVLGPENAAAVFEKQTDIATWMEVLVNEKRITCISPNLGSWLSEHHGQPLSE